MPRKPLQVLEFRKPFVREFCRESPFLEVRGKHILLIEDLGKLLVAGKRLKVRQVASIG